jgi:hypothetical protein
LIRRAGWNPHQFVPHIWANIPGVLLGELTEIGNADQIAFGFTGNHKQGLVQGFGVLVLAATF